MNMKLLPQTNSSTLHGLGFYTCPVNVVNPVTGSCSQALLNYDDLIVNPNAACAPSSSFASFPANVTGVMAFSSSPYAFPHIYNGVVKRFSKVTKRIPPAKPVAPFGLCYSTSTTGLKVPDINFILPDGKKWIVSTANSIKQITNEVACLTFVDGGAISEPAILIGTFQFEDNFLEFDLENWTLGFSSLLLRKQTSCVNFNFTLT
ncbi:hypothetical protein L1987_31398 [Smallanthus sonchifolius]|uniref:Uncharacterized protein n=1 Tax=Smallanthus sonchifolius TaxID=185202 RepID=A0ACB9I5F5_9ASTR|nr:hypothetical protein L1987_31398 [Smallanthus sonchifolius]